MPLFTSTDLSDELLPIDKLESAKTTELPGTNLFKLGKINETLESVLSGWDFKTDIHYVSHGHWSLHNLLEWILPKVGPCNLYIATWSLSEDATRSIISLAEQDLIKKIYAILDYRAKNRHEASFFLAQNHFAKIHTTACHAKVTVIQTDTLTLTINGSPNYTNNPRIESGVISVSPSVASFHINWIMDVISKIPVFD
jgi:hypothetical protein